MPVEKDLRLICDTFTSKYDFSGTCLVKQGEVSVFSYAGGMAHKGFGIPNRIDTKFNTASATKVFTAVAIVMMVERGMFTFSDRITDLIDLSGTAIPHDVTVEHLLTHTSGIDDDADDDDVEAYDEMFRNIPTYTVRDAADFLPLFAYKPPLFKAGTLVRYNNCAFILLGLAIEKHTGIDYRSFVMDNIVKPLGLQDTMFCSMDGICENMAEGYTKMYDVSGGFSGWKKNIYSFPPVGTPDAGIYTTVGDMDTFLRGIKDAGLLSETYSDMMMRPHCDITDTTLFGNRPPIEQRTGYALNFVEKDNRTFCVYKDGVWAGVGAIMSYYPESDTTSMILTNQDCNIWEMHRQIEDTLFGA